jgi:hypothetical protein
VPGRFVFSCALTYPAVEGRGLIIEFGDVLEQCTELTNDARQSAVRILYLGYKPANVKHARRNNTMFRQVTSQSVNRLRPLPHHKSGVLKTLPEACFSALFTATAHHRPRHSFSDCLSIGHVVFLPLDEWLDVDRAINRTSWLRAAMSPANSARGRALLAPLHRRQR